MTKCGICGKFLSSAEAAKCHNCHTQYHRKCASLPSSVSVSITWQCPDCKRNRVVNGNSKALMTPVNEPGVAADYQSPLNQLLDSSSSTSATNRALANDITAELIALRDNLRSINKDLQLFRDDIADIRSSLRNCENKVHNLEDRVSVLEKRDVQPEGYSDMVTVIAQLKQDLNDRDQEMLSNDLEVSNLPESAGENPIHLAIQVSNKLGMNIENRDIVSAERVGGRHIIATAATGPEPRPRTLVIRLARRDLRDEMLRCARVRRGVTSADLGMTAPSRPFYINERLTKPNRWLFRQARQAAQRHGWKFVWTSRGRVLARNKPGDQACLIRSETDIQRIFTSTKD